MKLPSPTPPPAVSRMLHNSRPDEALGKPSLMRNTKVITAGTATQSRHMQPRKSFCLYNAVLSVTYNYCGMGKGDGHKCILSVS